MTSHSGRKPFTCSFCSLSFSRLDNLKTHIKTHNKERPPSADAPSPDAPSPDTETRLEVRKVSQLQPFPSAHASEPEIQLVVTGGVDHIQLVPGQDQELSLMGAGGAEADQAQSRLTLLTQGSGHALPQGGVVEHRPQMSVLQTQMSPPTQQMHVITLSTEALDHLQAHQGPPPPLQRVQVMPPSVQRLTAPAPADLHSQPISISQTSQQISSHHIQGQTFQIQAGTVSYLYTTGLPHD